MFEDAKKKRETTGKKSAKKAPKAKAKKKKKSVLDTDDEDEKPGVSPAGKSSIKIPALTPLTSTTQVGSSGNDPLSLALKTSRPNSSAQDGPAASGNIINSKSPTSAAAVPGAGAKAKAKSSSLLDASKKKAPAGGFFDSDASSSDDADSSDDEPTFATALNRASPADSAKAGKSLLSTSGLGGSSKAAGAGKYGAGMSDSDSDDEDVAKLVRQLGLNTSKKDSPDTKAPAAKGDSSADVKAAKARLEQNYATEVDALEKEFDEKLRKKRAELDKKFSDEQMKMTVEFEEKVALYRREHEVS